MARMLVLGNDLHKVRESLPTPAAPVRDGAHYRARLEECIRELQRGHNQTVAALIATNNELLRQIELLERRLGKLENP